METYNPPTRHAALSVTTRTGPPFLRAFHTPPSSQHLLQAKAPRRPRGHSNMSSAAHHQPSSSPSSPMSPTPGAGSSSPSQPPQAASTSPGVEEPHHTLAHSPSSPSLEHQQHAIALSERNARSRDRPYTAHGSTNPFPPNAFILGPGGLSPGEMGVGGLGLGLGMGMGHYMSASARTSFTRVDTESLTGHGGGVAGRSEERRVGKECRN